MLKLFRASLAVLLACGTGCALLLDATTAPGDRCRFAGDDSTSCGLCLATHCQATIDRCCGDATCQATMDAVDRCAGRADVDACRALSLGTGPEDLAMCAASDCANECGAAKSRTSCEKDVSSCSCDADTSENNGVLCTEVTFGGICCADFGYPAEGLGCTCGSYACHSTEGGCECAIGGTPSGDTSESCSGSTCCVFFGSCRCGSGPCGGDEEQVSSCSEPSCHSDRRRVSSCSAKDP